MPVPKMTEEDELLIHKIIYLPILIKVFERDLQVLEQSPLKIKEPYIEKVEKIIRTIRIDLKEVKADMRKRGIKILEERKEEGYTEYHFLCRGYEGKKNMWNQHLKSEVTRRMRDYLNT